MAKKDFDYKQFLLEKGERIGLGVALAITLLLLIIGISGGLSAGSPAKKAKDLKKPTENLSRQLVSARPGPSDKPQKDPHQSGLAYTFKGLDTGNFALAGMFFRPSRPEDPNRARPDIYNVEEAQLAMARVQIRSYIFDTEGNQVRVFYLKGAKAEAGTENPLAGYPYGGEGAAPAGLSGFGESGEAPEVEGGMMESEGATRGGAGTYGLSGRHGTQQGTVEATEEYEVLSMPLVDLRKKPNVKLAEQVHPLRMAIITAAFPYKAQIEEFQDALGLRSMYDVLREVSLEAGPQGERYPNFRFLGVILERKTFAPDGKTMLQDWERIDLSKTYAPFVFLTGKRFESEDPKYQAVTFNGLVMPLLKRFKHSKKGEDNPLGRYPELASKVTKLEEALTKLESKKPSEIARPPEAFDVTGFDPFNRTPIAPPGTEGPPGTGEEGMRPGGGYRYPGARSGTGTPYPTEPGSSGTPVMELTAPDHCMVRVIDLTIRPGLVYKYRMKIRMGNPNYNRKDVRSPTYAQDKELVSEQWFELPEAVKVPPELRYYAVDQKELEGRDYKGPSGNPRTGQVILQMHRWLDTVEMGKRRRLLVGEWVVAERVGVYRGEYIGRPVWIQFPVWRDSRDSFVLAGRPHRRNRKVVGMEVDFGYRRLDDREAILVDFKEGREVYERVISRDFEGVPTTERVTDSTGTELLMLTPDGTLLSRHSADDVEDESRKLRLEYARERIKETKDSKPKKKSNTEQPSTGGVFDCCS